MPADQDSMRVEEARYDRAFELWPTELSLLAKNTQLQPHWLGTADSRFWFLRYTSDGKRFMLCDPDRASVVPAFDHELLASLVSSELSTEVRAGALPFDVVSLDPDRGTVSFEIGGNRFCWCTGEVTLTPLDAHAPEIVSPDGTQALFVRDFNLYRLCADGSEQRLTTDGGDSLRYGSLPDHDRLAVYRNRGLLPAFPPVGAFWSPDSRRVLCLRVDQSEVERYPFLESVPYDGALRPHVHEVRLPLAGDSGRYRQDYVLIDLSSHTPATTGLQLPEEWGELEINATATGAVFWREDASELFALAMNPNAQRTALVAIDCASGRARVVYEERSDTFLEFGSFEYHSPSVEVMPERNEAVWYSQTSGNGHLYLLDLTNGGIKTALTQGPWRVIDLLRVDPHLGTVWFTASGLQEGEYPYNRHLCRVELAADKANAGFAQITESGLDHALPGSGLHLMALLSGNRSESMLSPDCRYFVDNASSRVSPTRTVLRRTDGSEVVVLGDADVAKLEAQNWRNPESFEVALPGLDETIHGVIVLPRHFDPAASYPVVERIYAGPQIVAQPRNFHEMLTGAFIYGAYTLAEMGFAVVIMDGPGTPLRSKAFQDKPYGQDDRLGVRYHAAVLAELSKDRPWMSMDRVGVNGHSWGGHASAMAMLLCPETYHAGVSSAGIYDPAAFFTDAAERYIGSPDYGDGRRDHADPGEQPPNYQLMSPSAYADRLAGRLLLAYGDLDENALPSSLLRFYAALQAAGKAPDLLYLPGRSHSLFAEPFFHKQLMDYFLQHLSESHPAVHHRISAVPGVRPLI